MAAVFNVGGFTKVITVSPTVTAAAYSAGNLIGGKLTLAAAVRGTTDGGTQASGELRSLLLTDKANQKAAIDVVFFNADPTNTTFTDHAAVALNVADLPKYIGHVSILASDYSSLAAATNAAATKPNLGIGFSIPSGSTLYACLISRGTPTYASTSDLSLTVSFSQD